MNATRPSLAYRKNTDAIWSGEAPEKYTRLLPYIKGNSIFELGSAEGVLALLMAERGATVHALELRPERHEESLRLRTQWLTLGKNVESCHMWCGDIRQDLYLMAGCDTFVAVRSIYYMREDAPWLLDRVHSCCENIVLCGNKNRADMFLYNRIPNDDGLGVHNWRASIDGMVDLLQNGGYQVENIVQEGDPIVTGRRI